MFWYLWASSKFRLVVLFKWTTVSIYRHHSVQMDAAISHVSVCVVWHLLYSAHRSHRYTNAYAYAMQRTLLLHKRSIPHKNYRVYLAWEAIQRNSSSSHVCGRCEFTHSPWHNNGQWTRVIAIDRTADNIEQWHIAYITIQQKAVTRFIVVFMPFLFLQNSASYSDIPRWGPSIFGLLFSGKNSKCTP